MTVSQRQTLLLKFFKLLELVVLADKRPRRYGTGESFRSAEIHLIEVIGEREGASVSDIARHLSVTKGAVSQALKRLERRDLIKKDANARNLSRLAVGLTRRGREVFREHRRWHESRDGGFWNHLEGLSDREVQFLLGFVEKAVAFFEQVIGQAS